MRFDTALNAVFVEDASADLATAGYEIAQQLFATRQQLRELQHRLDGLERRMVGTLAIKIRRAAPGLNIAVSRDGCKVGYKTKYLLLKPDIQRELWDVTSNDPKFARKFNSIYVSRTLIKDSFDDLAKSVIQYFHDHYLTLNESIVGSGRILVDAKTGTMVDLVAYGRAKLNSRSSRLITNDAN